MPMRNVGKNKGAGGRKRFTPETQVQKSVKGSAKPDNLSSN
jgi:hypothetical protein